MRRSRRLVISSLITVGNYEYGFYWYFYQDGTIEVEVKLTGILLTSAVDPASSPTYGRSVSPGVVASHHQHFFNVRLDMCVDGPATPWSRCTPSRRPTRSIRTETRSWRDRPR